MNKFLEKLGKALIKELVKKEGITLAEILEEASTQDNLSNADKADLDKLVSEFLADYNDTIIAKETQKVLEEEEADARQRGYAGYIGFDWLN